MSKKRKLEEGLAGLFSSRIDNEALQAEDLPFEPTQDFDLSEDQYDRESGEDPGSVITINDSEEMLDESPGNLEPSSEIDSELVQIDAVEDSAEIIPDPVMTTDAEPVSGMDFVPDSFPDSGPEPVQELETGSGSELHASGDPLMDISQPDLTVEEKASEWLDPPFEKSETPVIDDEELQSWIDQHPDADRDLRAFAEAVREMPILEEQEEIDRIDESAELQIERFVIFDLGGITFGVDVHSVLTIIKMMPICPVPHSADYISGLINLRGQIIPVLDLAKRITLADEIETNDQRIVVVEREKHLFGFIVDKVRSVAQIPKVKIKEPSRIITKVQEEYLSGIAESEGDLVLLLGLERLLQR